MKKYWLIIVIVLLLIIFLAIGVLLKKGDNNETITYELIADASSIEGTKSEKNRGYEIVEKENDYYLIIYGGERPTTDTLEISNVEVKGKNVNVTVKYVDGLGDAFSYPKALIKFDKEPKKINVIYK